MIQPIESWFKVFFRLIITVCISWICKIIEIIGSIYSNILIAQPTYKQHKYTYNNVIYIISFLFRKKTKEYSY